MVKQTLALDIIEDVAVTVEALLMVLVLSNVVINVASVVVASPWCIRSHDNMSVPGYIFVEGWRISIASCETCHRISGYPLHIFGHVTPRKRSDCGRFFMGLFRYSFTIVLSRLCTIHMRRIMSH